MDDHPDRTWNPTWSRNSWTSGCVFVKADAGRIKIMQSRQTTPRPLTHTNTPPPLLLMLLPAISVFIIIFHASSCSDEQQGVIYTALNLCYFYSIRVSKNKQTRKQKSWALMSEVNFPSEVKGFWLCDFLYELQRFDHRFSVNVGSVGWTEHKTKTSVFSSRRNRLWVFDVCLGLWSCFKSCPVFIFSLSLLFFHIVWRLLLHFSGISWINFYPMLLAPKHDQLSLCLAADAVLFSLKSTSYSQPKFSFIFIS